MTSETFSKKVPESKPGDPNRNGPLASSSKQTVVIIDANKSSVSGGLRELWAYRELLYFLIWRDVKVRYKQTLLGATWAILQPVLTMLIFNLLFGKLGGIKSDGVPYPLFAYAGLLVWTFFANAVTNSGNSLVGSAHLITKIYFPRMIVPAGAVAAGLVDLALAFVVQVGLLIYYGVHATWALLMVFPLVMLTTILALGIGMWLSALNVKYRDVRYAIPFLIQLWMFASPIIYPVSMLPQKWRWVVTINPVTGIIQNFRIALFGNQPFVWKSLAISALITAVVVTYAAYSFRRMERRFADIV